MTYTGNLYFGEKTASFTEAKEPIDIIIGIPEKLQEKGRTYVIIRAHDGVPAFMNDMDDESGTITVSTDLFL